MGENREWRWQFCAFESAEEGRPVQAWFDNLPSDIKDEICDLLAYLEKVTSSQWRKPEFDPLEGEEGISEVRPTTIQLEVNGEFVIFTCRLYGFFGPLERTYCFLHGGRKEKRNDRYGKRIAKRRLEEIISGRARIHQFEFKTEPPPKTSERAGGAGPLRGITHKQGPGLPN